MQDLCHAARYIRMSSNPAGGFLIKFFFHIHFLGCIFSCVYFYYYFLRIVCFDFCVFLSLYCIVLYFFNITMKFSRPFIPSLAVGVLLSSAEPPSLAVSVSFLNVRFDRASFPYSIAQISSFELSSA